MLENADSLLICLACNSVCWVCTEMLSPVFFSGFLLKLPNLLFREKEKNPDSSFSVSFADSSGSTKEPRPDQTFGLICPTASAFCCHRCCYGNATPFPSSACLKLKSRPISESAPPSDPAASGSWVHLFNTHVGSVSPLLTQSVSQSAESKT